MYCTATTTAATKQVRQSEGGGMATFRAAPTVCNVFRQA
jgi:hypothetical protein